MKRIIFLFSLITLFLAQDLLAQPTGRRSDAISMSPADITTLATAMLGYIDQSVIENHSCNNEFGDLGGAPGTIHGPEVFMVWHRNYMRDMETAIAPTLNSLGLLNDLLPRWKHTDGFGPEPPGMERMLPFLQIDADCAISCGSGNCNATPNGTTQLAYPFSNPLPCTWSDFMAFSEGVRSPYHNSGHGALGGIMSSFKSPSSPIFWLWHAMIDEVWWDYQDQCVADGDLYIQDTPADTGLEANPDTGPMWISQDIWVRNDQDTPTGGTVLNHGSYSYTNEGSHQNPEYKNFGDNYVYVRVRNRSTTDEYGGGKLRVYWSKASTGLNWPTTWEDYFISGVLHGDEMEPVNPGANPVPINVTMILPPIAPGGQYIVEIPWTVPNPADFTNDIHHFCLLARMISPWDDMFIPEGTGISANVRNNNNIAWKNVSVVDLDPNNIVDPGGSVKEIAKYVSFTGVYVTNPYDSPYVGHLTFKALKNDQGANLFKAGGFAYARMDEKLYTAWRENGLQGEAIRKVGWYENRYYILLTKPNAAMYKVNLNAHANMSLEVGFAPVKPMRPDRRYDYDVCQLKGDQVIGGERYEINTGPGIQPRLAATDIDDDITIAPNPTSDFFTVTYAVKGQQDVSMNLYNLNGQLMNKSVELNVKEGRHVQQFDGSDLSSGIYFLQIRIGDNQINKKVIIE